MRSSRDEEERGDWCLVSGWWTQSVATGFSMRHTYRYILVFR